MSIASAAGNTSTVPCDEIVNLVVPAPPSPRHCAGVQGPGQKRVRVGERVGVCHLVVPVVVDIAEIVEIGVHVVDVVHVVVRARLGVCRAW